MAKVERVTEERVLEELGIDKSQKLKIRKLLNSIYSKKAVVRPEKVLEVILNIYLADKSLSAIDDIYIIAYGDYINVEFKYSFWPKKMIELGVFKTVDAYVVREGEEFSITIDNGNTSIKHIQNPFATDKPIIGAYARGIKEDGSVIIATANLKELNSAAKASKIKSQGRSTVWDIWFEEIAKKLPLKRLMKLTPIPEELQRATELDNTNYASIEEMAEDKKKTEALESMEELNKVENNNVTLEEYLTANDVEFELRQGYIKVEKDIIEKMQHGDVLLKYLKEYAKMPGYLVGMAAQEIDIPTDGGETEVEYV